MVGRKLGNKCVSVFMLMVVIVALEHDTPLHHCNWVGKSICLLFDLLQIHILGRLSVNDAKTIVVSFICSREVHLKPILSRPSAVIHSLRVVLPCVWSYSVSLSKSVTHFVSLMGDTLRPSYDESFPIEFNSLCRS